MSENSTKPTSHCGYCNQIVPFNTKSCPSCGGLWPVSGRSPFRFGFAKALSYIDIRDNHTWEHFVHPLAQESLGIRTIEALVAFSFLQAFGFHIIPIILGAVKIFITEVVLKGDVFLISSTSTLEKLLYLIQNGYIVLGSLFAALALFVIMGIVLIRFIRGKSEADNLVTYYRLLLTLTGAFILPHAVVLLFFLRWGYPYFL